MCDQVVWTHLGDLSLPALRTVCSSPLYRHSKCRYHFSCCPLSCQEPMHRNPLSFTGAKPFLSANELRLQESFQEADALWDNPDFIKDLDRELIVPVTPSPTKRPRRSESPPPKVQYKVSYGGQTITSLCDGLCSFCPAHAFQLGLTLGGISIDELSSTESETDDSEGEVSEEDSRRSLLALESLL